jgi:hypothetical protein
MDIILGFITGTIYEHYAHALSAGRQQFMVDKQPESVFSYVERIYFRLQAGDVLVRCLEDESPEPISDRFKIQASLK